MDSYQNDLYLNAQLFAKLRFTVRKSHLFVQQTFLRPSWKIKKV